MKILNETGLTYDDVLLVPQKSSIDHRADVSLRTQLTPNIKLGLPFLSANMETVTESPMAMAMARSGGLGVIHRFMSIEDEVSHVKRVKRQIGYIIKDPATLYSTDTLDKAYAESAITGKESFLIINKKGELVGILSKRDYLFEKNTSKKVGLLMTKFDDLVTISQQTSIDKARKLFEKYKVEKLPIIDSNRIPLGLITSRSIEEFENYPNSSKDSDGRYLVAASVGVVGDYMERAEALVLAGVDALVVDVAHGHNNVSLKALKALRKKFKTTDLIGGNVATAEATEDLIKAGANCVKVGIGPGGLCTTRVVAGAGVPQLTAVINCAKAANKLGGTVIADGGTNFPGDITKALSAGASAVMLAGWFAGTDESPGEIIFRKGSKFKVHRGSASFMSVADRKITQDNKVKLNTIVPEGVESLIAYKGAVTDVIDQLSGALRSGMSYCNAKDIKGLWKNATFIKITASGFRESKAHNINEL